MFPWPIENNNFRLIICCTLIEKGLVEQFNLRGKKHFHKSLIYSNVAWLKPKRHLEVLPSQVQTGQRNVRHRREQHARCGTTSCAEHLLIDTGFGWTLARSSTLSTWSGGPNHISYSINTRALGSSFIYIYLFWLNEYAYFKTCFIA